MAKRDLTTKMLVGITYNLKKNAVTVPGDDAEVRQDNYNTILAIKDALESGGYEVELFEITEDFPLNLIKNKPDVVFNIADGISGRGKAVQVPAILNALHIPFTGSDETAILIAMDKALAKGLLGTYGIRTPKYNIVEKNMSSSGNDIHFPVIVKPIAEGSGRGISDYSLVSNTADLHKILTENIEMFEQNMLVEEYIQGREFTVGIVGNGSDLCVFSPMEVVFKNKKNAIYSYEIKKNYEQYVRYKCPPDICLDVQMEMKKVAGKIYRILGCRDYARIDFRLSLDGLLYFLEVNPLPGLTPGYSDLPMIAEFCGVEYDTLIQRILKIALARYELK